MTIERRGLIRPPEMRASDGAGRMIFGHAAVFNSDADIGGYFVERILPGAFANAIKEDIRSLFNHDSALLLGRTKSGTLRLNEDDVGLYYEVDLPDTTAGRDVAHLIDRGDITGNSFQFRVLHDEWDSTGSIDVRTIHEVELIEVGPVTFPAYDDTDVAVRSSQWLIDERTAIRQREQNHIGAAKRLKMKANLDHRIRGMAGR